MHNDIQRALSGMPVAAPTRTELYQGTRRMGQGTMQAGPTSAIPAYRYGPEDEQPRGGRRRTWLWVVIGLVALLLLGVAGGGPPFAAASGGQVPGAALGG